MTRLVAGGVSDVGRVRSNNQDAALLAANVFAVADGMGGHAAGEVASRLALETFEATFTDGSMQGLVNGVRWANRTVFQKAIDEPDMRGMGTTLCAVALVDLDGLERIGIVNVGDSRVYVLQDGELRQVTHDHSVVEEMVRDGALTPDEAKVHPQRNMLTRALGIDVDVQVDSWEVRPHIGDRYLLCSDGLFNELRADEIADILREQTDPEDAARLLVERANERGGRDNVTAVVVDVLADPEPVVAEPQAADVAGERESAAAVDPRDTLAPMADSDEGALPVSPPTRRVDDAPTLMDTKVVASPAEAPTLVQVRASSPSRVTWRVVLFVGAVLAVIVGAVVAVVAWPEDDPPVRVPATTSTIARGPTTTIRTGTTTPRTTTPGTTVPGTTVPSTGPATTAGAVATTLPSRTSGAVSQP